MSKFVDKGKKDTPCINTASLPDIMFIVIMLFMVSVSMRQTDRKVMLSLPAASEAAKLERKDLASYIYIGTPTLQYQRLYGTESQIQLNDAFRSIEDIRDFIASERESLSEAERPYMTVSIKADENTRMGIITDVKQELRRCSALRIMYGARKVSAISSY